MIEATSHIGILYVSLFFSTPQSLKEKRMVLKKLKERIRSGFNVSVGELDGQDKWQVSTLGIASIGRDKKYIDADLRSVLDFLEHNPFVEVTDFQTEFL